MTEKKPKIIEARGIVAYQCAKCCCTVAKLIDSKDRRCHWCGHVQKPLDERKWTHTGKP